MPRIRIEWVPVQAFGLGFLGFDHLQLVYQQDASGTVLSQDEWYVMEGVRETDGDAAFLGIQGADGRTTLAAANLAARADLVTKIGTPDYRGSRCLSFDGNELQAWEMMASIARDIERQDFPYVAYGPPGSPVPTINSSSAAASLIHYSGLDPSSQLPFGLHRSPGTTTLLGTGGDDTMRVEHGFTTLLGGDGRDTFVGDDRPWLIEKYYGGGDDDLFRWSAGFNIIHGGQPQLGYEADGTDVIDYSGAGTVTITFNRHWIPHKVPHYVATFGTGLDHLFSVERIQWNEASDRIVLGKGVGLVEDDIILEPGAGVNATERAPADPSQRRSGRLVPKEGDGPSLRSASDHTLNEGEHNLELTGSAARGAGNEHANRLIGNGNSNILDGMAGDDTLYGGGGNDTLVGGAGSDRYVYLPGDGDDIIIDDGPAGDSDVLVLAGGIEPTDVSAGRSAQEPGDLVLSLRDGGSILIKAFYAAPASGIELVVFDRHPAWTREDVQKLAATASWTDGDTLVFRPELVKTGREPISSGIDSAPAEASGAVREAGEGAAFVDLPTWAGLDLLEGWLF